MSRVRAWVTVAAVAASFGSLTMSCGSDELTGKATGGGANTGGSGGGSSGKGGGGGISGNTGTGGAAPTSSNLGKACLNDANCGTTSGLSCINQIEVPNGLCTADCKSDADCQVLSAGARCTSDGFCLEGCTVGAITGLGMKCHTRSDFGCRYYDDIATTKACTTDEQCGNSAICDTDTGTCITVITTCQPICGSDDDCMEGNFCNIGTGLCQATPNTGKAVGHECNPEATTKECLGSCIGDADGGFTLCTGSCIFGAPGGCGWNGQGPADAGCLFVPVFNAAPAPGDVLYCGQLCDCDADCHSTKSKCVAFENDLADPEDSWADFYGRKGLCATAGPEDVTLPTCGSDGEGGAGGGAGAGGVDGVGGAAGNGGTGGAPSGGSAGAAGDTSSGGAPPSTGGGGGAGGS